MRVKNANVPITRRGRHWNILEISKPYKKDMRKPQKRNRFLSKPQITPN